MYMLWYGDYTRMLSIFPDLLAFSMLAITLIRVTSGYLLLMLAIQHARVFLKNTSSARMFVGILTLLYTTSGILLVIGLFTQIAALIGALLALFAHITAPHSKKGIGQSHLFLLLFVTCLSLLFLGPGVWAVDMPL
jgi:uncharacterized membrane protein YphA (DoxX/SURF4 family)